MIKKRIGLLFILTTAIIVFNFYYFVKEQSLNQYADWLINYQGGFVRRGLIGEFFYKIHIFTLIRLDVLIFLFVSLFYIFFYKNLLKIIKRLNFHFINLLIIFSPMSFFYPVMEEKASGRKDILFLFLFSIIALYLNKISFYKQKYLIILFSGILIFSHTGFFFLLPAFLIIFLFFNKNKKIIVLIKEVLLILSSLFIFLIIIMSNKIIDTVSINLICNSISDFVRDDCAETGYISTLSWTLQHNLAMKEELWVTKNYNVFYFVAFIISYLPLLFAFYNSRFLNYKKLSVLFFFSLFILMTLPLYYLGVDYGRYLHLTYISLIIMYSIALQKKVLVFSFPKIQYFKKLKIKSISLLIIIFIYGFTFTIPHCCNNNFKFNYSNVVMKINEKLN